MSARHMNNSYTSAGPEGLDDLPVRPDRPGGMPDAEGSAHSAADGLSHGASSHGPSAGADTWGPASHGSAAWGSHAHGSAVYGPDSYGAAAGSCQDIGLPDPDRADMAGEPDEPEDRAPRRVRRLLLLAVGLLILAVCFRLTRCGGEEAGRVRVGDIGPSGQMAERVSAETSPAYQQSLDIYADTKAREALAQGGSFVAPASGVHAPRPVPAESTPLQTPAATAQTEGRTKEEPRPAPRTVSVRTTPAPSARRARPAPAQPAPAPDPAMSAYLARLGRASSGQGQTLVLNSPRPQVLAASQASRSEQDSQTGSTGVPGARPGDILYAVNRVTLDSDAPGPAMVEIVSGPWRGARAIGTFQRQGGHLVLRFTELACADGRVLTIQAYAIDPKTDRTAVRTSQDTHFLERWGGLVAASFLEGFGDAVSRSGTSSYNTAYGSGWSAPNYSVGDEAWIAAGKVGERMAAQMEKSFARPPTVVLASGTDIGVLLLRCESRNANRSGTEAPRTVPLRRQTAGSSVTVGSTGSMDAGGQDGR